MARSGYDEDRRYCADCERYVHYLQAPDRAFCAECGGQVRLFSSDDMESFRCLLATDRRSYADPRPLDGWEGPRPSVRG